MKEIFMSKKNGYASLQFKILISLFLCLFCINIFFRNNAYSAGNYTIKVGEVTTLSWSTSKVLNSAVWYSNAPNNVQVISSSYFTCQIKGIAASSSKFIIRCDYYYWVTSGAYRYLVAGGEDFYVHVEGTTATLTPRPTSRVTLTPRPSPTPESTPTSKPVSSVKAKSVKLNKNKANLKVKGHIQLTAKVSPGNASKTYKKIDWSSNHNKIAKVSVNGKVTGLKPGKATITAKTKNNKKASCVVTVKKKT